MKQFIFILSFICAFISIKAQDKMFTIADRSSLANLYVDNDDWKGVKRAANDLCEDIQRVTGQKPNLIESSKLKQTQSIIIGTIGHSKLIDRLIAKKKINVDEVKGKWESYLIQTSEDMIIIAGSDKRGTIYGIYDLSQQIGVSPWYWWADAPTKHQDCLYIKASRIVQPSPKVKYRGIFINDEWPSFGTWATSHFGDLNSKMYAHLFELLLRLKANYLWPAMWNSSFNEDDSISPILADEYGIVMGTSHHEPMMRAHKEYVSRKNSIGPWDYTKNKDNIDKFFSEGLERNHKFENIITIGMRGDGDVAMGNGDDKDNMETLKRVINSQRQIIRNIYNKDPQEVPQLWAIFTEVQRYYDAGFTVPDDVTLMFCDNNWGYIRRIGLAEERKRKGGLGLYYHIDMNGGPWNDRWVNTTTIPKLREQLNLAYKTGIDRIWLINVGDLKPKELPIDFIMHYAWNPDAIQPGEERKYVVNWAQSIFDSNHAEEIADILCKYPKYNLWRKPEVQETDIMNEYETDSITALWQAIVEKAEHLKTVIPIEQQDAFYELVYYPAVASAGVAEIYNAATKNHILAARGDTLANVYTRRAKELFIQDSLLTEKYNKVIAGGKWAGMMQDKHIGYKMWSMPNKNTLPSFKTVDKSQQVTTSTPNESKKPFTSEYSIAANHYTNNIATSNTSWIILPDLGRGEACMGINDVNAPSDTTGNGPRLEYQIKVNTDTVLCIAMGIRPTQDVYPARGLRIGVRLDNGELHIIDARKGLVDSFNEYTPQNIKISHKLKALPEKSKLAISGYGLRQRMRNDVFDDIRWLDTAFNNVSKGIHTLQIIMIDPEVVFEQLVINPDNNYPSYFGVHK